MAYLQMNKALDKFILQEANVHLHFELALEHRSGSLTIDELKNFVDFQGIDFHNVCTQSCIPL